MAGDWPDPIEWPAGPSNSGGRMDQLGVCAGGRMDQLGVCDEVTSSGLICTRLLRDDSVMSELKAHCACADLDRLIFCVRLLAVKCLRTICAPGREAGRICICTRQTRHCML